MLSELRIASLGVIEAAEITLRPGLTVVTGETGAGKTMIVHSLSLLLGAKGDAALVRSGATRSTVEGRLRGLEPAAAARATDAGAEFDDGELIAGRSVAADTGRSRAWLGGAGVPAGALSEVVGAAVVLHGQHDQQRLVRPAEQRQALDRFGGDAVAGAAAAYRRAFDAWSSAAAELRQLREQAAARAEEAERLAHDLAAVDAARPEPGEDLALRARAERLRNATDLQAAAASAQSLLAGDDGDDVVVKVAAARRALDSAAAHDPSLTEFARRADEVALLAGDLAGDLASYAAGVESDPAALAATEDRRAALSELTRRHGPDIDAVLAWAEAARSRLLELSVADDRTAALGEALAALDDDASRAATALTAARVEAAGRLAEAVGVELAGLAMSAASVSVEVTPAERSRHGADAVEFLLTAHAGAPPRPLAKGASGGELSRVMLALEVVLAAEHDAATLIFDEVDAGVGGRAAVEIGRRLARLARTHQVICVTHLPQVAAFADAHLLVAKSDDGSVTVTDVRELDDGERVIELSRMLGGVADSDLARGHARELLDLAHADAPTAATR